MKKNFLLKLLVSITIEVVKLFKSDAKNTRKCDARPDDHHDHEHNSQTN